jgi:arylsulfatase A-like enzyme
MKRRTFLQSASAVTASALAGVAEAKDSKGSGPVPGAKPNILFILVDELRYPSVFPDKVSNVDEFLCCFMPNVHKLWKCGVKFSNYHTAANACTPARGTIISGLYSHQSWLITTILSPPDPNPTLAKLMPVLNPAYPTYGKLLQKNGYQTPYFGKWHVSLPQASTGGLNAYGFDHYTTYPDPTGSNLQGTYGSDLAATPPPPSQTYLSDADTASAAVEWLGARKQEDSPWCMTVGFVNPHDKEFFPAGTEFQTFSDLFANPTLNPDNQLAAFTDYSTKAPTNQVPWDKNELKSPKSYGYPELPPNWESTQDWVDQKKPTTQLFIREFQEGQWGGITQDPSKNTPGDRSIEEYPATELKKGVAKFEFTYWQRGLDQYTQVMMIVDKQIGRVLDALESLPSSIKDNTVVVFTSDHGEYAGAHGLVQGKIGSIYEEAWHIPLIVVDPSERFTANTDTLRTGLASSVDLMCLLVSLGYLGTRDWMTGFLHQIYGSRLDMIAMLKSASAPGRPYILHATDEINPNFFNWLNAPTHVLGIRTEAGKLGVSADWFPATSVIKRSSAQLEYYDYSTERGRLELDNTVHHNHEAHALYRQLLHQIIPNELQQPLPPPLRAEQEKSKIAHLIYRAIIENLPLSVYEGLGKDLSAITGWGAEF